MNKIPVGHTLAQAYGFAFRDFLKILGVIWFPLVLTWAPSLLLQQRLQAASVGMMTQDFSSLQQMWWWLVPLYLFSFVLMLMQVIGVAKQALGNRPGPVWFYFRIGMPVWRLIGSLLLLIVAALLGGGAVALANMMIGALTAGLVVAAGGAALKLVAGIIAIVMIMALWCAWVYAMTRLSFLLVPVIAAEEEGFALGHAWTLGKGNFWRMFAIMLVLVLPLLALEIFAIMSMVPMGAAAGSAAAAAQAQTAMAKVMTYWYIVYPAALVVAVLFYGSVIGAQCFAYRALRPEGADADAFS